jgi:putative transposase
MGTVGDAYDNAMAESFFASLECELINRRSFKSKAEARLAIFTWIEGWYNPRRRHSALDYLSPANFERKYQDKNLTSAPRSEHGLPTVGRLLVHEGTSRPPVDKPAPSTLGSV